MEEKRTTTDFGEMEIKWSPLIQDGQNATYCSLFGKHKDGDNFLPIQISLPPIPISTSSSSMPMSISASSSSMPMSISTSSSSMPMPISTSSSSLPMPISTSSSSLPFTHPTIALPFFVFQIDPSDNPSEIDKLTQRMNQDDVDFILSHTQASRKEAEDALRVTNGDLVEAIGIFLSGFEGF